MNLIKKIQNKGIKGCLHFLKCRYIEVASLLMFQWYSRLPVDEHSIVLESEGDCCDNAFALFDYMKTNGYIGKYHITWLVDHPENFHNEEYVKYCYKHIYSKTSPATIKVLAQCHWYIFDHCNMMANFKKRNNQLLIYLSHGWGYKAAKGAKNKSKCDYDYMTATGPLAAKGLSEYWNRNPSQTIITGYPRLDYLFENNENVKRIIEKKWCVNAYSKLFFWMPTFRKSNSATLSENYIVNETGLPIFNTISSLEKFDDFLNKLNILLVFKLHHLQAELPVFNKKFSNIVIVRDDELQNLGVQLYQLVRYAECMISDYSSITIDYLLMDKPIIYTLDDYKQYEKSRGLFPKNAIDFMPGYHVYSDTELINALIEVNNNIDLFKDERKKVIDEYHTYKDGGSAKRVLDTFGIMLN